MNDRQQEVKNRGQILGYYWKDHLATKGEVARLKEFSERLEVDKEYGWEWWLGERSLNAFTPGEFIYFVVAPKHEGDREASRTFWSQFGDDADPQDGDFVHAFAQGALVAPGSESFCEPNMRWNLGLGSYEAPPTYPFQYIGLRYILGMGSPLVHVISADHIQDFAKDNCDSLLTEKELRELTVVFVEMWDCEYIDNAIATIRPWQRPNA